jgi:general secretion pathway protein L
MSTLIVALPVPPRLSSQGAAGVALAPAEYDYVFSGSDAAAGRLQAGRAAAALLPTAQQVVAVIPAHGVGWHRVALPKAPAAKLRAALAGVLEDVLLEDDAELHLALPPHAKTGEQAWVAAVNKSWLKAQIDALEAEGQTVDRVVPAWAPDDAPAGHFFPGDALSASEVLFNAARGEWNLRQFDLTPQRRGSRAAKEVLQQLWSAPAWRPARFGVAALLLLNLVGVNVWAWQQNLAVKKQKAAMTSLLQTTFPQIRAVTTEPSLQMQREVDLLRASAGKPGESDLEPLMYAAEAAWPPSRAPADGLKYEPGQLTISSAGWSPQEVEAFRGRLAPLGYDAESVPGRLTLKRARLLPDAGANAPTGSPGPGGPGMPPPGVPPAAPPRPAPQTGGLGPTPARPLPAAQSMPPAQPPAAQAEQPHRMPGQSPTGVNNNAEM